MGVLCAAAEKSGLLKRTAVKLKAVSTNVGLPNKHTDRQTYRCMKLLGVWPRPIGLRRFAFIIHVLVGITLLVCSLINKEPRRKRTVLGRGIINVGLPYMSPVAIRKEDRDNYSVDKGNSLLATDSPERATVSVLKPTR